MKSPTNTTKKDYYFRLESNIFKGFVGDGPNMYGRNTRLNDLYKYT